MGTPSNEGYNVRSGEILRRLPIGPVVGVEVGVFCGETSAFLLDNWPALHLFMVDSWQAAVPDTPYALTGDPHTVLTQEEQDTFHSWAVTAVERFGSRATILRETSWQAAQRFGPSAFDFVFLDGDHSYSGVVADISAWASKIKPRGLLCGHDYYADFKERPFPKIEVRRAVDEFVAAAGLQLELGGDMTWFVRMP